MSYGFCLNNVTIILSLIKNPEIRTTTSSDGVQKLSSDGVQKLHKLHKVRTTTADLDASHTRRT
jgi:hypothetical protein